MKDALAIHRWLLAHQVHHEIVRLPRPMKCAEELPATIGAEPERCVAVTVFEARARLGREVVAFVSTVAHPPSPGQVGRLLRVRSVRPAPAFVVNATTDYAAGLVSPLLLPRDLPLLVDDRLTGDEGFLFTPTGERRTALRLHSLDLLRSLPSRTIELPAEAREAVAVRH